MTDMMTLTRGTHVQMYSWRDGAGTRGEGPATVLDVDDYGVTFMTIKTERVRSVTWEGLVDVLHTWGNTERKGS